MKWHCFLPQSRRRDIHGPSFHGCLSRTRPYFIGADYGGNLSRSVCFTPWHVGGHARIIGRIGQYLEIPRLDGRARRRFVSPRVYPVHAGCGASAHDRGTAHRPFDALQCISGFQDAVLEPVLVDYRRIGHCRCGDDPELLFGCGGLGVRLYPQGPYRKRAHAGSRRGQGSFFIPARLPVEVAVLAMAGARADGFGHPAGGVRRH